MVELFALKSDGEVAWERVGHFETNPTRVPFKAPRSDFLDHSAYVGFQQTWAMFQQPYSRPLKETRRSVFNHVLFKRTESQCLVGPTAHM